MPGVLVITYKSNMERIAQMVWIYLDIDTLIGLHSDNRLMRFRAISLPR